MDVQKGTPPGATQLYPRPSELPMPSWLSRLSIRIDRRDGLTGRGLLVAYVLTLLVLFCRNPSLFTHAQFYAEDGHTWFAQGYNEGWLHALFNSNVGYLSMFERLPVGLALAVPFRDAPLVLLLSGLLLDALLVPVLLCSRCAPYGSLSMRLLLALLWTLIPKAAEVHVVLTNCMWHLAVVVLLLAFAKAPRTLAGRAFDLAMFLIMGFTGPFCILLMPFLLTFWFLRRQRWSLVLAGIMSLGIATQLWTLARTVRPAIDLGASVPLFIRMLAVHIFSGALLGGSPFKTLPLWLLLVPFIGGLTVCAVYLRESPIEGKLFLLYCALLFAGELRSPLMTSGTPAWIQLLDDASIRYWYIPMLAFVLATVWAAFYSASKHVRIAAIAMLCMMPVGIIRDFRYAPLPDAHFEAAVATLQQATPGSRVELPIPPAGWSMVLIKKP